MESNKPTKEEEGEKKPEGDAAAAAKSMDCDRRNDCDDAESSSGSEPPSSSSQGTSGGAGYSGDYSSISDSSETGGSQSKPEGGKKISVSEPILKNKGGKYARRQQKRTNKSTEGVDANLPDADRSSEHIHHYHHHRQAPSLYSQDANSDEDINLDMEIVLLRREWTRSSRWGLYNEYINATPLKPVNLAEDCFIDVAAGLFIR